VSTASRRRDPAVHADGRFTAFGPKANIELFMRRFAGETFDTKRRDRKRLGAVEK
jgi:hypothetical protein